MVGRRLPVEGERGLGKIVSTEGKEFGSPCQLPCSHTGADNFDHPTELEIQKQIRGKLYFSSDLVHVPSYLAQLGHGAYLRSHDFRMDPDSVPRAFSSGFENGADLHLADFGSGDAQSHHSITQHRICFPKRPCSLKRQRLEAAWGS